MIKVIERFLNKNGYYKIDVLQAGAHCGCCGKWMPESVTVKHWAWDLCNDCIK